MFGIKLKVLKRSGRFNNLNETYSSLAVTPPLNGAIRGQPVCMAILCIKLKVFLRPLRKYNFIVFVMVHSEL